MLALREIIKTDSDGIILRIPAAFRKKEIEIIVLEYKDKTPAQSTTRKLAMFDTLVENAKKRNIQVDPSIKIDDLINEMNNGLS